MNARTIGTTEIDAAVDATVNEDSFAWLLRSGVSLEAMQYVCDSAQRMGQKHVERDGDLEGAFVDIAGQSFRLGFEVGRAAGGDA